MNKDLFEKKEREAEAEKKVNDELKQIIEIGIQQQPIRLNKEEIKKGIKKLKNKKAADKSGWKNEMIKEGGEEMERSLMKIFNKTMDELEIPKEWENMIVKSIYKNT